jgi:hypothetical protein
MCAHRLLTLAANQWPHRIAYSWDIDPRSSSLPQELTYAQLLEWAQATAASLKAEHFEGLHLDVSALGRPLIAIAIDEVCCTPSGEYGESERKKVRGLVLDLP